MDFTIADGVVALVILVSAFLAYNRGLTRELMAIGAWIIAGLVAVYFAPMVAPIVLEIPVAGEMLASSCTLTALAAFVIVFVGALIILSFFTPLLSSAVHNTPLASVDRGLGFLFGVARGVLLVGVVYLLYNALVTNPTDRIAMIEDSASSGLLREAAAAIEAQAPTDGVPDWLQARIDHLLGACAPTPETQASFSVFMSEA